jgi:hypothetical protein
MEMMAQMVGKLDTDPEHHLTKRTCLEELLHIFHIE